MPKIRTDSADGVEASLPSLSLTERADGLPAADDPVLALDARAEVGVRLVRVLVALLDLERDFVGAAVLGPAQRADRPGEALNSCSA